MSYTANENRYQEMVYRRCGKSGIRYQLRLRSWHTNAIQRFLCHDPRQ